MSQWASLPLFLPGNWDRSGLFRPEVLGDSICRTVFDSFYRDESMQNYTFHYLWSRSCRISIISGKWSIKIMVILNSIQSKSHFFSETLFFFSFQICEEVQLNGARIVKKNYYISVVVPSVLYCVKNLRTFSILFLQFQSSISRDIDKP